VLYQLSYIPKGRRRRIIRARLGTCQNVIAPILRAASLGASLLTFSGIAAAPPATGAGPTSIVAAASRCNSRMINDYEGQIRNFDAHPARGNPADLSARLNDIGDILQSVDEEHNVLDSICPSEADKAPLFAQLAATTAWGLALQSDIAVKLNASCPPAAKALPTAMLAGAWLAIAATVNDANGNVPKSIAEVIPKVQTRAAAVGLALPAYPETSAYWRDQAALQAKAAVESCATPASAASPSPAASPKE
jgi:hypothetical protein